MHRTNTISKKNYHKRENKLVKLPARRAGLPGKETMLTLHPLSPPTRRGLRYVLPVKGCSRIRYKKGGMRCQQSV